LQTAGSDEVSFLSNRKYVPELERTGAGAVIVSPELGPRVPATAVALVTSEPYAAWARVAALFHPLPPLRPGIHPPRWWPRMRRSIHPPRSAPWR